MMVMMRMISTALTTHPGVFFGGSVVHFPRGRLPIGPARQLTRQPAQPSSKAWPSSPIVGQRPVLATSVAIAYGGWTCHRRQLMPSCSYSTECTACRGTSLDQMIVSAQDETPSASARRFSTGRRVTFRCRTASSVTGEMLVAFLPTLWDAAMTAATPSCPHSHEVASLLTTKSRQGLRDDAVVVLPPWKVVPGHHTGA